jgi:hypothetical protein
MPVAKTTPFFTMAEPTPSPSRAFQATFFSAENSRGRFLDEEIPLALTPLNCGQSSA